MNKHYSSISLEKVKGKYLLTIESDDKSITAMLSKNALDDLKRAIDIIYSVNHDNSNK